MATPEDSTLIETINRPIDPFASLGQINTQSSGLARGKKAREMEESFLRRSATSRESSMVTTSEAATQLTRG